MQHMAIREVNILSRMFIAALNTVLTAQQACGYFFNCQPHNGNGLVVSQKVCVKISGGSFTASKNKLDDWHKLLRGRIAGKIILQSKRNELDLKDRHA